MSGVKLAAIIREKAGLKPWEMHKRMGKKTVQAYLSLERSAKRITPKDFTALEQIFIEEALGDHGDFWELVKKCAKSEK